MKVLILDDDPERHAGFEKLLRGADLVHAYTYTEFISALRQSKFDMLCMDFDLHKKHQPDMVTEGGSTRALTGADAAAWLADHPGFCPDKVLVHSHNPEGAARMESILRTIRGTAVVVKPYTLEE